MIKEKYKGNIYFVENIVPNYTEGENETNIFSVVLLETSVKSNILNEKNNYNFKIVKANKNQIDNIYEGQYVFYSNNQFINANNTSVAKRNIFLNNFYRGKLIKKQSKQPNIIQVNANAEIYSYHINVGHGNCSIIVIVENKKTRLWMIDCSNFDIINKQSYQNNINACFKHIKNKFNLNNIVIEHFFLTHTHYDHYSGILALINSGKINNNTTFFLNTHYSMPSENYNRLLNGITALGSNIIEPLSSTQQNNLEIWYPDTRTIRSMTSTYRGQNVNVVNNPNNSSVLYYFNLNNKRILFTGDLETIKLNIIKVCPHYLKDTDYYVVSHHGSINGHIRNSCPVPNHRISNLSHCVKQNSTQILMGRDGAFTGIYSQQVINDFNNLIYSEKDNNGNIKKFVEIKWKTNSINWH
jgi:beta-lactamase superfamily II metal-dependent hydrolase